MTVIPALIWIVGVVYFQPKIVSVTCLQDPSHCVKENVIWPDRLAVEYKNGVADRYSNVTQNLSGVLALTIPVFLSASYFMAGSISAGMALSFIGIDSLILLQATLWNGAINTMVRLVAQRPRPFVYRDPEGEGSHAANYTSFYSGHTSFAALSSVTLFLTLMARGAPLWGLWCFGSMGLLLTFLTGAFRVFAGRHFFSDVVFGALAGVLIAFALNYLYRKSPTFRKTQGPS